MMAGPTLLPPRNAVSKDPAETAAENGAAAPVLVGSIEAVARSRLLTVLAGTRLIEVAAQLSGTQISVVVVCDEAGAAIGTITETLLIRHLGLGQADFFATHAGEVMIREFTTCEPEELLSEVLAAMQARSLVYVLLVGPGGQPLGVLNARDGLRALLAAGNQEEALLRNYVMGVGYQ
jgi:CBS domain-containing protein